jgi:hypothetical protein
LVGIQGWLLPHIRNAVYKACFKHCPLPKTVPSHMKLMWSQVYVDHIDRALDNNHPASPTAASAAPVTTAAVDCDVAITHLE